MADSSSDLVGAVGGNLCGETRMGLTDAERERLIEAHRVVLELEPLHDMQCSAMKRMRALIAQRSPERIREMETAQGLG